ncbi:MAG: hypothetical protein K8T90_19360 [Planctomycetes bacterium]|nr:hypothetical protein [Planctomycetota bacterium]
MRKVVPLTSVAALLGLACLTAGPVHAEEPSVETGIHIDLSSPAFAPAGEVVRGGVPLPRSLGVKDPSRLGLWRATSADGKEGAWVPTQWQVLSRHDGTLADADKAVRWALLQFPANDGGSYWLRDNPATSALPNIATETGDRIDVDTGALRFTVAKDRFAPLSGLRTVTRDRDGREIERAAVTGGGLDVKMTMIERGPDGTLVDRDHFLSTTSVSDIAIEENGPVRTAIRIRGKFSDDQGRPLLYGFLGYTIRIWADKGSDSLRVFFTLENNGNYGPPADPSRTTVKPMWIRVRDVDLVIPTTMAAGKIRGSTADGSWDIVNGGPGVDFRLLQTHEVKEKWKEQFNFNYTVSAGGKEVARGARSQGGLQVDDGTTAITTDVRHFWQSYPKAVSFDDGRLEIEMWPKEPGQKWPQDIPEKFGDAYEFEGGRHKTYEMLLSFAPSSGTANAAPSVAQREKAFQNPAYFAVDPAWVKQANVVGGAFALPEGTAQNPSMAEARAHFAKLQKAIVDVKYCDPQGGQDEIPPCSLNEQRESRGYGLLEIAPYDMDMYGFMNFGDMPHDKGYCSVHHDLVGGMFLNWLRHGKREFHDIGVEMLRHRYDIDQYHCQERADPNWKWYNGFQRGELGFHGARLADFHPHGETTGSPQATWLEGLLLAYAVTGDPKAMDCARDNADAFVNYFQVAGTLDKSFFRGAVDYFGQLSAMSNGVEQLLAFYDFTGERKYFDAAAAVYENGLLRAEEYYGNKGFFDIKSNQISVWTVVRLVHPLIEMHRHSNDPRALSMLLRVLRFFTESAYDGGFVDDEGRYLPLQLPYQWELEDNQPVARRWFIPYNFFTADGFAYAYAQTKEPLYLQWARRVWRDGVIFYQAPVHQSVNLDFYSPASYAPRQYPDSETKNDAWVLGLSQYYLGLEDTLAARSQDPIVLPDDAWFAKRTLYMQTRIPTKRVGLNPVSPSAPTDRAPWVPSTRPAPAPAAPRVAETVPGPMAPRTPTAPSAPAVVPAAPAAPAAVPAVPGAQAPYRAPVGQAENPNPAPQPPLVRANLESNIYMDDRDAVFASEWSVEQSDDSNAKSMRVYRGGQATVTGSFTIPVARAGTYRLYLWWPEVKGAATNTPVEVRHEGGWDRYFVNQTKESGRWRMISTVSGSPTQPVVVKFGGVAANGAMVADAVRLEPVLPAANR